MSALFDPARYTVVEASTKVGKTVSCLIWLGEQAFKAKPHQNFWWCAPVYVQSAVAFRRMKEYLPREVFKANEADLKLSLFNGATIWFKSAEKADNLYGEDVFACVIDEASRVDERSWHAIRTTLTATRGPVKIIGNVKGRRNWAYELGQKAQTKTIPDLSYHKITAWDAVGAGILKLEEVEDAKRMLPVHVFRQDYEAIPADDAGNPFGLQAIRSCIREMSDGEPVCWGWDLARAQDWVVGIALDQHAHVCRFERWQAPWRATKSNIAAISRNVPALIDSTGVGDPILEDLQAESKGNFSGFHFTGPSKQNLMERLASSIQQAEIGYPADDIPHRPLVNELESFEYTFVPTGVRYSAPPGRHDDCVIALGLALWHFHNNAGDNFLIFTANEPADYGFADDGMGWSRIS